MPIHFYEEGVTAKLKAKLRLKKYLQSLIVAHLPQVKSHNINYIFCDDAYLLQINQDFLNHDTLTDIITFDLSETQQELVSEIYISVERIADNAKKYHSTYDTELHRVIFHGILHLCGFKDKNKEDAALMRKMEDASLAAYIESK